MTKLSILFILNNCIQRMFLGCIGSCMGIVDDVLEPSDLANKMFLKVLDGNDKKVPQSHDGDQIKQFIECLNRNVRDRTLQIVNRIQTKSDSDTIISKYHIIWKNLLINEVLGSLLFTFNQVNETESILIIKSLEHLNPIEWINLEDRFKSIGFCTELSQRDV